MRPIFLSLVFSGLLLSPALRAQSFLQHCLTISEEVKESARTVWQGLEREASERSVWNSMEGYWRLLQVLCPEEKAQEEAQKAMLHLVTKGEEVHIQFMEKEMKRVSNYRVPEDECREWVLSHIRLGRRASCHNDDNEAMKEYRIQGRKASVTRAKTCSDSRDRSDRLGPVRDQDSMGWCYAFTAADLLTFKTGKTVSALQVANTYNNYYGGEDFTPTRRPESQLRSGNTGLALSRALEGGLCTEDDLPSEDTIYPRSLNLQTRLRLTEQAVDVYHEGVQPPLEQYWATFSRGLPPDGLVRIFLREERHPGMLRENFLNCPLNRDPKWAQWKRLFPSLNDREITDIFKLSADFNVVDNLVMKTCQQKGFFPEKKYRVGTYRLSDKNTGDMLIRGIDVQLNRDNMVGISYHSSKLYDRYRKNEEGDTHASSIIGRRFNPRTGSCEYLLRNSWGPGFNNYDPSFESRGGNAWIPEEYLTDMLLEVTYVE